MKLSQRLGQIDKLITTQYDHIWDCCCDHGLLGAKLLQKSAAGTVHFVDVVEDVMVELESKLMRFFPQVVDSQSDLPSRVQLPTPILLQVSWQVHCIDVAKLPLALFPQQARHLIIIAGVGGDLLIELVQAILSAHNDKSLEFILCPVHHNYKVRSSLIDMNLHLLNECLVKENNRFYEIIHLTNQAGKPLSKVGSQMWDFEQAGNREYLQRTILHYQRMNFNDHNDDLNEVIADYQRLEINQTRVSMA